MLITAVALVYYDIHCEVYCMYEYQSESYMPAIVCHSLYVYAVTVEHSSKITWPGSFQIKNQKDSII